MSSHFVRMGIAFGTIAMTGLVGAGAGVGWFLSSVNEGEEERKI
jgi:hypothetical protein